MEEITTKKEPESVEETGSDSQRISFVDALSVSKSPWESTTAILRDIAEDYMGEAGCLFYVCGIFLVRFLYGVLRASEKRAVSSFPLSCMPRLIHSSSHP